MLDIKEEREYRKLRRLGQKLHIPIPEAFLTLEVLDKDGNPLCPQCSFLIASKRKTCPNCGARVKIHQRSHSWVRNAYNFLFGLMASKHHSDTTFGAGLLSIKDTGGTIRYATEGPTTLASAYNHDATHIVYGLLTPSGQDTKGIVVGLGTNAESFEDYALQTQIANGTGTGQLSYIASELHSISYAALTLKDTQIRYFNNNSGGAVLVNEVALYLGGLVALGANKWCHSRDKLASTVTIPNTGQLKVSYVIELTYPA